MNKSIILAVANVALAGLIWGCGESVPQRSAVGGILAGTDIERQRLAARKSPLMAGNGTAQVVAAPANNTLGMNRTGAPGTSSTPGSSSAAGTTGAAATPAAGSTPPSAPAKSAAAPTGTAGGSAPGAGTGAKPAATDTGATGTTGGAAGTAGGTETK